MYIHRIWRHIPVYPGWFYFHPFVNSGKINMDVQILLLCVD